MIQRLCRALSAGGNILSIPEVSKTLISRGTAAKGYPLMKDSVQIAWKIYLSDGSLAHDSAVIDDEDGFTFIVGAEPRQVIQAWDIGVRSMFEGEKARFVIPPRFGFGETGVTNMIPPNETITCELELVRIIPSVLREVKRIGANESIQDDLMEKIESGESVVSENVKKNKPVNETSDVRYFDASKHKVNPDQRVSGRGKNFIWNENPRVIEIEVILPRPLSKSEIQVSLNIDNCRIAVATGEPILVGEWHGRIIPRYTRCFFKISTL